MENIPLSVYCTIIKFINQGFKQKNPHSDPIKPDREILHGRFRMGLSRVENHLLWLKVMNTKLLKIDFCWCLPPQTQYFQLIGINKNFDHIFLKIVNLWLHCNLCILPYSATSLRLGYLKVERLLALTYINLRRK